MTRARSRKSHFVFFISIVFFIAVAYGEESGKWTEMSLPAVAKVWTLKSVAFGDSNLGWAVGAVNDSNIGIVLKYEAGAWKKVFTPSSGNQWVTHLVDISLSDAQNGWAVGDKYYVWSDPDRFKGLILRLKNGAWSVAGVPNAGSSFKIEGVSVVPKTDTAWAVGGVIGDKNRRGLLLQYSGGAWKIVALPDPEPGAQWELKDIDCPSADQCWAVGNLIRPPSNKNPFLIFSYRGGTWKRETAPNPPVDSVNARLSCVSFANPGVGWAAGKEILLAYRNGRWEKDAPDNLAANWHINGINVPRPDYAYAVGMDITSRTPLWLDRTQQGWRQTRSGYDKNIATLEDVFFLNQTTGWAVGGKQFGSGDYPAAAFKFGVGK